MEKDAISKRCRNLGDLLAAATPEDAQIITQGNSMELALFCDNLLSVLEEFDEAVLPFGLYASDDLAGTDATKANTKSKPSRQEWHKALAPYLQTEGYRAGRLMSINPYTYRIWFHLPELGSVHLTVVRFSKIKVRKYGSSYRVDIHEARAERWKEVDVSRRISRLWKLPDDEASQDIEVVLLIGFDKAKEPLSRELLELQRSLKWETKDVVYLTRAWEDKAKRGFAVRLAAWARLVSSD
jgi:hypothetical protein